MSKKLGVLFFSLLMVGCLNASSVKSAEPRFRFFLVSSNSRERSYEVSLGSVTYDDTYVIYSSSSNQCYGFYRCLVPNIFAHVENPNLDRKRFLNVQTGECFDVEPVLNKLEESLKNF
jgi:hypothetical protein